VHAEPGECSRDVAARVTAARAAQRERYARMPWSNNGDVPGSWLRGAMRLSAASTRAADRSLDRGDLTVRGYDRILRVAWTLADLSGRDRPRTDDIDRALALRHQGRVAA